MGQVAKIQARPSRAQASRGSIRRAWLKSASDLRELLLLAPGPAAAAIRVRVAGIETNRLGIIGDRVVVLLDGLPRESAVAVTQGLGGLEPDGLAVVVDGLFEVFLLVPEQAAAVIRVGVSRLEPDGLAQVGDRLVGFTLVFPGAARTRYESGSRGFK